VFFFFFFGNTWMVLALLCIWYYIFAQLKWKRMQTLTQKKGSDQCSQTLQQHGLNPK